MMSTLRRATNQPAPVVRDSRPLQPAPVAPIVRMSSVIDYRDRISVATWVLVFGLGLRLLFEMPKPISQTFMVFNSPFTIVLSDSIVAGLVLGALVAGCTESVMRVHPRFDLRPRLSRTWPFWALPVAQTVIATVVAPMGTSRLVQVLVLLVYAVVLATTFFSLYASVEAGQPGYRRGRAVLSTFAYASALLLFVIVYQTRTRSLLSGTLVAATATLLAIELLRTTLPTNGLLITYGAIVGMVLGQATWAVNYWPIDALTGGLMLALLFYLLVGIAQQGIQERLKRRVLLEYAGFSLVVLLLIALLGNGFRDIRNVSRETPDVRVNGQ